MPSGLVIVYDEIYDQMLNEALDLVDPSTYFTILQGDDGLRSGVMYVDGDLYNWSFVWGKYIKVLPLRALHVNE